MLPFIPILILLLLQGSIQIDRLAVDGRLGFAFSNIADPERPAAEQRERTIVELLRKSPTPSAPVLATSAPSAIVAQEQNYRDVNLTSDRSRDGPAN